jgi:hypothetical protein
VDTLCRPERQRSEDHRRWFQAVVCDVTDLIDPNGWPNRTRLRGYPTTISCLKHGVGPNHCPSGSFVANAAWLHLNTLSHNLLRTTNQLVTPTPIVAKGLRYRYLTIPGCITTGSPPP